MFASAPPCMCVYSQSPHKPEPCCCHNHALMVDPRPLLYLLTSWSVVLPAVSTQLDQVFSQGPPAEAWVSGPSCYVHQQPCPAWEVLPHGSGSSQGEETFPLSQLPPRGARPIPIPLFSLFVLPSYMAIFLAPLIVWNFLPAFSRYSMRIVPHIDVFLRERSFTSFYSAILISTYPATFQ